MIPEREATLPKMQIRNSLQLRKILPKQHQKKRLKQYRNLQVRKNLD